MARRKEPIIPDAIVGQLLAGTDPKTIFDPEPPRVCRRPSGLSYAAMAGSSSMA